MSSWVPPLCFGLAVGASLAVAWGSTWLAARQDDLRLYAEVRDFVLDSAVRPSTEEGLSSAALHGLVGSVDEYSRYYDAEEALGLERETEGRYRGIGAVFRAPVANAQVLFTLPGSPARESGLRPGDRILRIDGEPVAEFGENGLRERLGREEPPLVGLDVCALTGEERHVELRKRSIVDPTVRHAELLDAARGIGYVAINSFSHETVSEFDQAVDRLRGAGARSLVLDLRGNPGGVLLAAVEIARRFVTDGTIVSTEGRGRASARHLAERAKAWYHGLPLVVLVDERSASASEVLAGALQDHREAVILGERTYGKGTVQTIRRFPQAGGIAKVTTSYYFTPRHRCLERSVAPAGEGGIEPDLCVELAASAKQALHAFLARYSPPGEELEALRAWEAREHVSLVESRPADAQLEAALGLLRGDPLAPRRG